MRLFLIGWLFAPGLVDSIGKASVLDAFAKVDLRFGQFQMLKCTSGKAGRPTEAEEWLEGTQTLPEGQQKVPFFMFHVLFDDSTRSIHVC